MTRNRRMILVVVWGALLVLARCGGSTTSGDVAGGDVLEEGQAPDGSGDDGVPAEKEAGEASLVSVDTVLSSEKIDAGGSTTVTCHATYSDGKVKETDGPYTVTPDDGVTQEGGTITATKAGAFDVACSAGDLTDDSPAVLQVMPGAVEQVTTALDPAEIDAGGASTVTCAVLDHYGNSIQTPTVINVPEEVSLNGNKASATKAGEYDVECSANAFPEAKTQAAVLTVKPLAPVGFKLALKPEKPFYKVNDTVTLRGAGVDQYGNETGDVALTDVSAEPAAGLQDKSANGTFKYTFLAEGHYTFKGAMADDPNQTGQVEAVCDGTGPQITVDYPERGLTLTGAPQVNCSGTAFDPVSTMTSFTINGQPVTVNPDGTWAHTWVAVHGQNFLVFSAQDEWGNTSTTRRAFHFSSKYYDYASVFPEDSLVPGAITAFLGRKLFIDEDPNNQATLSAIASMILKDMDLGALLPNPVAQAVDIWPCKYDISLTNIHYETPVIKLNPVDGGLHLYLEIPAFQADFALTAVDGAICLLDGTSGIILADKIILMGTLAISLDANRQPVVELQGTTVDIQNLQLQGTSIVGSLMGILISALNNLLTGIMEGVVEGMINDQVTSLLQDAFNMLQMDMPINFDIPLGAGIPVSLQLVTRYEALSFATDGGLLGLTGTIRSEKKWDREPLGSIARDGCLGVEPVVGYSPAKDSPVEAAAYDDLLNQALFAIVWGGTTDLHITAEDLGDVELPAGIKDLNVDTHPLLAPVIDGCGADGKRRLQVGDFWVNARFTLQDKPVDIELYLFAETSMAISTAEVEGVKKVAIAIEPFQVFEADITRVNDEWKGKESVFQNLIGGILKTLLEDTLADADLSFAIPVFQLSSLQESLPADKGLTFELTLVDYAKGFTVLKGVPQVVAVDPANPPGGLGCGVSIILDPDSWQPLLLLALTLLALVAWRRRARA
jgi:hypothetical protein